MRADTLEVAGILAGPQAAPVAVVATPAAALRVPARPVPVRVAAVHRVADPQAEATTDVTKVLETNPFGQLTDPGESDSLAFRCLPHGSGVGHEN
jgi:hypothetical protein